MRRRCRENLLNIQNGIFQNFPGASPVSIIHHHTSASDYEIVPAIPVSSSSTAAFRFHPSPQTPQTPQSHGPAARERWPVVQSHGAAPSQAGFPRAHPCARANQRVDEPPASHRGQGVLCERADLSSLDEYGRHDGIHICCAVGREWACA